MSNSQFSSGENRALGGIATFALTIWILAVCLLQWIMFGPHVSLTQLTGVPLDFVYGPLLDVLRRLLTAPLGS